MAIVSTQVSNQADTTSNITSAINTATSAVSTASSEWTNVKKYLSGSSIKYVAIGAAVAVMVSKRLRNYAIIAISGKLIYDIIMNFGNIKQSQQSQQVSSQSGQNLTVIQPPTAT
jgi:hypothetical protein